MHIVVRADDEQKNEFLEKGLVPGVRLSFFEGEKPIPGADAYFDLCFEDAGPAFNDINDKPVFINTLVLTGEALPANAIRINAWTGFLQRDLLEISAQQHSAFLSSAETVLQALHWKYQVVPDEPGMVSARIIAMIINEAYFGLGDGISSKAEIDIAMKLGTNYPYGPFEWAQRIGLSKIHGLLHRLSAADPRYAIAPALENEINIA